MLGGGGLVILRKKRNKEGEPENHAEALPKGYSPSKGTRIPTCCRKIQESLGMPGYPQALNHNSMSGTNHSPDEEYETVEDAEDQPASEV